MQKCNLAIILTINDKFAQPFGLISRLLTEDYAPTVLAFNAYLQPEKSPALDKIRGLAQLSPRLKIYQLPDKVTGPSTLIEALKSLTPIPEFVVILDKTKEVEPGSIYSVIEQMSRNERIGLLKQVSPAGFSVYRYSALRSAIENVPLLENTNLWLPILLEQQGWQCLETGATETEMEASIVRPPFIANLQQKARRIISYLPQTWHNVLSFTPSRLAAFSFNTVKIRSLGKLLLWLFILGFGSYQLYFLGGELSQEGRLLWQNLFPPKNQTLQVENTSTPIPTVAPVAEPTPDPCVVDVQNTKAEQTPLKIVIPVIDLNLEVKSVPLVDGTWAVYDYAANFAQGTSLPNGISGNTGLYGHDRPQAFANIKRLSLGNEIYLLTDEYRFQYQVGEILPEVQPNQLDVFEDTAEPQLTLVTCQGVFSKQRFVVKARLIGIDKHECIAGVN